jgi:hypothetical protein
MDAKISNYIIAFICKSSTLIISLIINYVGQVPSAYTITIFELKIFKMFIVGNRCGRPLQFYLLKLLSYPLSTILPKTM